MKKIIFAAVLLLISSAAAGFSFSDKGKVAEIELSGNIKPSQDSAFSTSGITPNKVEELNQKAKKKGVDAVIYDINSGGGAVVASKEVYRIIDDVEVPTVCRFRDTAASGGYMIALGCDKILADSASLTGSIGVKASYLEYSGLLKEFGVDYVNISAGESKEVGSPFINATEEEKQLLREKMNIIQEDFLELVEKKRNLSSKKMEVISSGEPFLGVEAEQLGLVDSLGGEDEALRVAENLTGEELEKIGVGADTSLNFFSLLTSDLSLDVLTPDSAFRASTGF